MGVVTSFRQTTKTQVAPEGFETVQLTADDGVTLSAWSSPSQNGAAVILVHGSGGSLESLRGYADMLAGHGYGVLALGLRGHGGSGGGGNALGWECGKDVAAAVNYVSGQNGVNAIGALGLSLGGEVLLSACSDLPQLKAVVSEGATHHTIGDYLSLPTNQSLLRSWTTRVMYFSAGLFTGQQPPETTITESIKNAHDTRFLFIAAENVGDEIDYNTMFNEETQGRSELWAVPDAGHTQGFALYPDEYESRVIAFFDETLTQD
jgi:pimeloyl-ACP methyl ester carboxylesterase